MRHGALVPALLRGVCCTGGKRGKKRGGRSRNEGDAAEQEGEAAAAEEPAEPMQRAKRRR